MVCTEMVTGTGHLLFYNKEGRRLHYLIHPLQSVHARTIVTIIIHLATAAHRVPRIAWGLLVAEEQATPMLFVSDTASTVGGYGRAREARPVMIPEAGRRM